MKIGIGIGIGSNKGVGLGTELVTNGDFSSATGHTLGGADLAITGGQLVAVAGAASKSDSQTVTLTTGKTYRVTITVAARAGGGVTPQLAGGTIVNGMLITTAGTFSQDLVAVTGNTTIRLSFGALADMSVDNWSVRQFG